MSTVRRILEASFALALATLGAAPAVADPDWRVPPQAYRYDPAPCPEQGVPVRYYTPCADQMALFAEALATARRDGKLLLVKLGANWCPGCRALHRQLAGPETTNLLAAGTELGRRFHLVEIATTLLSGGRVKPVPSGEAVAALILAGVPQFRPRAIPLLAVIDPQQPGKAFLRHVGDLAAPGQPLLDPARLTGMLDAAARHIRHGEPAPLEPPEPGWLMRQLLKVRRILRV